MNPTEEKIETPAPSSQVPATRQQSAPLAPPVPVRMGLMPQSIEEGWRLATMFAKSELVPKNFRNKPEDILVAIELGVEIGLAPMQALQSIAVINGRPSVWGDGFIALIMASPLYRDHDEYFMVDGARQDVIELEALKKDTTMAVCTFWRHGKTMPVTRSFSVGNARKAGLLGKEGPWQQYPDRMLRMRARSFAGRDAFPDLLRGIRTAEEARDIDAGDDDPPFIDAQPADPIQPRRASEVSAPPSSHGSPETPAGETHTQARTEAASAPNAGDSGTTTTRGRVAGTGFVRPREKGIEPYYEIVLDGAGERFATRDERVYKEAVSFEGTDHVVALTWQLAPIGNAADRAKFVESIAIDEGGATLFDRR